MKKIVFALSVLVFAQVAEAQIFGKKKKKQVPVTVVEQPKIILVKEEDKKDVPPVVGIFSLHPDSVLVKGLSKETYFFFLDAGNKSLFVTKNKLIYDSVSTFLPVRIVDNRYAVLQGTAINPFTEFSEDELDKVSKKLGIRLNEYKIIKVFAYGLVPGNSKLKNNFPEVIYTPPGGQ